MRVPGEAEIEAVHRRFAADDAAFELVWTHCRVVRDIVRQLSPGRELAEAGALLHDVGVYRLGGEPYIRHGVIGEELLREAGFPPSLCRFASHHTGVGLTKADIEAQNLPLPHCDFLAETPEEELVMYADKFHSKTTPPTFWTYDAYARRSAQWGPDNAMRLAALRDRFGLPDLEVLAAEYGHAIRRA